MTTHIGNVAVFVADLDRATAFYTDVLGLEVLARIDVPEVREVIVGAPGRGSQLMLAKEPGATGAVEPSGFWKVFVQTDDIAGLFERAVAAGAEVVEPPRRLEQFDITIAMVKDPDGYLVELGQLHGR